MNLGDTLGFSARLYTADPNVDPAATPVNATTTVLTITLPDGTTAPGVTVTNPPAQTGVYLYPYFPAAQAGTYVGRWVFTMASGQTTTRVEQFDVLPANPNLLFSLSRAKIHLNIPQTDTSSDVELFDWIAAITGVVEDLVGLCAPRTIVDEFHENGDRVISLRETPVISVLTVNPYLTAGTVYGSSIYRVTPDGRLMLLNGLPWYGGPFAVTYRAGRQITPPAIGQAGLLILGHLWETQRGAATSPRLGGDDAQIPPGFGFAIPNRALELLEPYKIGPGVG